MRVHVVELDAMKWPRHHPCGTPKADKPNGRLPTERSRRTRSVLPFGVLVADLRERRSIEELEELVKERLEIIKSRRRGS